MKHKKVTIITVALVLIMLYAWRFHYINSQVLYPVEIIYGKNEEAEIGNNFFNSNSEKMNGYSVTVKDKEIMDIKDFLSKYNVEKTEAFENNDYICLVTVDFRNFSNKAGENAGINVGEYMITNKGYMNYCDRTAYEYVNDYKSLLFSLREGTSKEFIIPFTISEDAITKEEFIKGDPQLVISLYPVQQSIML